jgi:hypothetical protein
MLGNDLYAGILEYYVDKVLPFCTAKLLEFEHPQAKVELICGCFTNGNLLITIMRNLSYFLLACWIFIFFLMYTSIGNKLALILISLASIYYYYRIILTWVLIATGILAIYSIIVNAIKEFFPAWEKEKNGLLLFLILGGVSIYILINGSFRF